jgi:hypothetical protein
MMFFHDNHEEHEDREHDVSEIFTRGLGGEIDATLQSGRIIKGELCFVNVADAGPKPRALQSKQEARALRLSPPV